MRPREVGVARVTVVAVALAVAVLAYVDARSSIGGQATAIAREQAPAERAQRLQVERAILRTELVPRMEAAMGSAFGGVWFEPSTAQLHVGVTSPASRRDAEEVAMRAGLAANVTETSVRSTWATLVAAQERWNRRLADLLEREEAVTSVAPDLSSVKVELGSSVPSARRVALEQEAETAGVDIAIDVAPDPRLGLRRLKRCDEFAEDEAFCDSPIVGGVSIVGEKKGVICSAGPAIVLKDKSTWEKKTETYLLTAGHCIDPNEGGGDIGEKWFAYNKEGNPKGKHEIGKAVEFLNTKRDVGAIKIESASHWVSKGPAPVTPTVALWDEEEETEPFGVTGQWDSVKGTESCYSGQTSGMSCGTIKEVNVTVGKVEKLVEVEKVAAGEGDSGGPWFAKGSPSLVEGTMVGKRKSTGNLVFQSLKGSFEELTKYELLISSEEVRHPFRMVSEDEPTVLTGEQHGEEEDVFEADSGSLSCSEVTYSGELPEAEVAEISLAPSYSECFVLGVIGATVDVNGCEYVLKPLVIVEESYEGSLDIVCPEGEAIEITAPGCIVAIGPQTDVGAITYTNVGSGDTRELTVDINLSEMTYEEHDVAPLATCVNNTAPTTNGTYTGSGLLTGEAGGGGHLGIWVE